ncbi:MAG TPA: PAS domain-containing protein [Opitutaceae bacterium]|jgi:PAS domain S-box-containing protein|nr:PAS domain-containing protein [Opitutaceae bacterium]
MTQKLTLSEYAILVEQAPIMIWRAALSMGCDYFNDVWLAFTGRTLAQEIGNGWTEGVHPDDFARCLAIYTDHFQRRSTFEMEYRLQRHDGAYRWIFDRGTPYFDESGVFLGFIGSCIDVTERVEAQAALKEAKEREIDQLRGFIPICSYCKKIRNDRDYWEQIEEYITQHSHAQFTHGVCPECQAKVMAKLGSLIPH